MNWSQQAAGPELFDKSTHTLHSAANGRRTAQIFSLVLLFYIRHLFQGAALGLLQVLVYCCITSPLDRTACSIAALVSWALSSPNCPTNRTLLEILLDMH